MKLSDLKPPDLISPPAWRQQLVEFWRQATDQQRLDLRVTLRLGDAAGAQRILESWQQQVVERRRARRKSKKKPARRRFQYGVYGGWFYPGFHNNSGTDSSAAGADGGGGESIQEQTESDSDIIQRFAASCAEFLGLRNPPGIRLRRDPEWTRRNGTFGRYTADPDNRIELATSGRHIIDILRTLAHEMTHAAQNEQVGLPDHAGETGSEFEDSANAMAGRIMRHWAQSEPHLFRGVDLDEGWRERAAGLATAACVAGTPGCATTGTTAADALRTVQTIGRVATNPPTRAGAEEELRQELKNIINRGRGTNVEPRIRESSGYIPTEAEKDDPRFSMALTADVRPGETGRQANKLGLQTDSQGHPALLMKRLENLLESVKRGEAIDEDEDLQEVAMNPGAYRRFLASDDAAGIQAGFEAELIFRDAAGDEDQDSEPDWSADERAGSISDIIDFFQNGQDPISSGQAARLERRLQEDFMDWASDSFYNDRWSQEVYEEWVLDNIWPSEQSEYLDRAAAELERDVDDDGVYQRAREMFLEQVTQQWEDQGSWYSQAEESVMDDWRAEADESDWLDSEGLRFMSNVAEDYNLDWPYYSEASGGGSRDWEDIGASLSRATGLPVKVGSGYHSTPRRPGQYVVEPDSSIQADIDEAGLEIVSPPLPLPEALEQLRRVIDWANGVGDAYTNSSTGLHMGVSLPYKGGDVDPIKLILFMGDKELLERFDRQSNTYARSAYDRLRDKIRDMRTANPEQISGVMELMKKNLVELAHRDLERGVLGSKYVSVNPHNGYIEFRGPGGDYLAKSDEIDEVLENTMMQLAYAMHIAGRGDLYRDEYAKKLYKTLTGFRGAETTKGPRSPRYRTEIETETDDPFMKLFADYSAGRINAAGLKQRWAAAVLAGTDGTQDDRAAWQGKFAGNYEVIDLATGRAGDRDSRTVIDEFPAASDNEAQEIAAQKWSGKGIMFTVRRKIEDPDQPKDRRAKVAQRIRQAQLDKAKAGVLAKSQQTPSQAWRVTWREQRDGETVQDGLRIQADSAREAIERLQRTLQDWGRQGWDFAAEPVVAAASTQPATTDTANTDIGEPRPNTTRNPDANWAIVRRSNGEVVIPFIRNTEPEALEYFQDWTTSRVGDAGAYQLVPLTSGSQQPGDSRSRREYQIYRRENNDPIIGFMAATDEEAMARLERFRLEHPDIEVGVRTGGQSMRSPAQPQGEWTGRWLFRKADTGEVLHTISGIGNSQADANRYAQQWAQREGVGHIPLEVVPEMR
jgi:hypothetical protein